MSTIKCVPRFPHDSIVINPKRYIAFDLQNMTHTLVVGSNSGQMSQPDETRADVLDEMHLVIPAIYQMLFFKLSVMLKALHYQIKC